MRGTHKEIFECGSGGTHTGYISGQEVEEGYENRNRGEGIRISLFAGI